MSQKNGGRDPEAYEHIFIKQGDRPVELVMPPMDKQAKWDMERCARFVLDMLIKYGPAIQAEKENKAHQQI
jgi:hypothetical protein